MQTIKVAINAETKPSRVYGPPLQVFFFNVLYVPSYLNNRTEFATLNTNAVFVLFLFRKYNPTTINLECLCQISSFSWWRYTCIFDITGIVKVAVSTLIVYRVRFLYYKHVECADPDFSPEGVVVGVSDMWFNFIFQRRESKTYFRLLYQELNNIFPGGGGHMTPSRSAHV